MKKGIIYVLAVLAFSAQSAFAQVNPAPSVPLDPCVYGLKKSIAIAVSSATTTQFIAGVANTGIYVCGFQDSFTQGTAGTMQLEYGTGSTCAGGLTALTGVYTNAAAATVVDNITYGGTNATAAFVPYNTTGNSLCGLSTGTDVQAGVITYIQQ